MLLFFLKLYSYLLISLHLTNIPLTAINNNVLVNYTINFTIKINSTNYFLKNHTQLKCDILS